MSEVSTEGVSTAAKVWHLMLPQQRRGAAVLLALMLAGTILETLAIGLVTPVLGLMSQSKSPFLQNALNSAVPATRGLTHGQLLAAGMLLLVFVYALKAVFLAFIAWRQSRFVFTLQLSLSRRLFEGYLHQPYVFHLQRNSAQMIRNVVGETSQFSHLAAIPAITLLSEGLVLAGIGVLLVAVEPVGALFVIVAIGFAGFAFHQVTRMRLLQWGRLREHHEGMRLQHLQQGLAGVKDMKLLGREPQFLARYSADDEGVARVQKRQLTLQALPRLWLELLAVIGLAALVLTMLWQGRPLEALVPTLGVFAAAAFRLMPSVTKVLTSIQSMRFAHPIIETLDKEVASLSDTRVAAATSPLVLRNALQLIDVGYSYPGAADCAVRDIDLTIRQGASVGFVGGSGAGKSTLIDLILGLLTPSNGAIMVDGVDIQSNLRGWQNQLGYVPQTIYLTDDTVRANVAFGLHPDQVDESAVWRALSAAQLQDFVKSMPDGLDTFVGERGVRLSGGQRQRIGIARALYHDPPVLVLDEATSALDTATEKNVMEAVKALRGAKTILIIAHRTSTVEHCDSIVRLSRGRTIEAADAGQSASPSVEDVQFANSQYSG